MSKPKPPRELRIETLSDGRVWHRGPIFDDFTSEEIPWNDPPAKGELPSTGEMEKTKQTSDEHILREWIRQKVIANEIARRKRPFPRRDWSAQAVFERAFKQIKAKQ